MEAFYSVPPEDGPLEVGVTDVQEPRAVGAHGPAHGDRLRLASRLVQATKAERARLRSNFDREILMRIDRGERRRPRKA